MKKILLPGMMAALAFAACTNEDIVSQKTAEVPEVDLSNRPVVGMVDLNFGPQTRLELQDGAFGTPEYTPGKDMIGARLIDVVEGEECKGAHHAVHRYSIADYAWTNYRYDLGTDGKWTSGALMVEGNYMFYVPYNAEALYRTPLEVVFPTTQKVTTLTAKDVPAELNRYSYSSNTEAVDNFYKDGGYTVAVGHTFVDASKENAGVYVTPEMTQLYAYPQITLVNDYAIKKLVPKVDEDGNVVLDENDEPIMVEETNEDGSIKWYPQDLKIDEITILSSNIMLNGKINHAGLVNELKLDIEEVYHINDNGQKVVDCPAVTYTNWEDGQQTAWFQNNARTSNIVTFAETPYDANKGEKNPDGKITIELEEAVTIKPGQMVTLNVVMPAATYTGDNFKANVRVLTENEEGEVVRMMFADHSYVGDGWDEGKSLSYAVAKRYAVEEYNFPTDGSNPSAKTTAGALATFKLSGKLVDYDDIEDEEPETPNNYMGIENNAGFLAWLDGITDNSTPKVEANVMDKDHSFKLHEEHDVTLDAELINNVMTYMSNSAATLSFNTFLYVQGSDDSANPLVVDGAKFVNFGKVILKGGYVHFKNAKIGEVAYAENSDAVVSYEGGSVGSISTVNGNVDGTTLTGNVRFCGDLTLTDVTINGDADFDGACGKHTITLNGVTVTGTSHLSGKNNIVNNATLQGAVNVNQDATIKKLAAATVTLRHGGTITVAGEEAMTWNLDMTKGGKLIVNNKNWAPTTVATGDGNTTVEINADWAPESVKFAGTGDKIVDVNAAVGFTGINWEPKYNEEDKLVSSYTINNYRKITSDLNVPANAVYNQSVENAAVTGDITNNGTINAWGVIAVATNNGEIVAKTNTDEITVDAGNGKINNSKLAVVYNNSENQTIYYEGSDISAARISEIMGITDARINKIVTTNKWTVNSDWEADDYSSLKTIEFQGNGEMLYIGAAKVDFSGVSVIINGNMSWRGRSLESSSIVGLTAEYEEGATLSTSKINMTGAYADVLANGGTITLTDDIVLDAEDGAWKVTGSNVTIDLNGKTLSVEGSIYQSGVASALITVSGATASATIKNGTVNGGSEDYAVEVRDGATLTIESGNYTGACTAVYAFKGKIDIKGGNFSVTNPESEYGYNFTLNLNDGNRADAAINVSGGVFTNFNPINNAAEGEETSFVTEGYKVQVSAVDATKSDLKDKDTTSAWSETIKAKHGDVTYKVVAK